MLPHDVRTDELRQYLIELDRRKAPVKRADAIHLRFKVWAVIDEMRLLGRRPDQMEEHLYFALSDPQLGVYRLALAQCVRPWIIERYYSRVGRSHSEVPIAFNAMFRRTGG